MTNFLNGQVALITGAGSGIGEAIAQALGAHGVKLALAGRRLAALEAVSKSIGPASPNVRSYECDLSDEAQIRNLAGLVQKDFGGVDILVHSAGIFVHEEPGVAASPADLDRQHRVNLLAPGTLTQLLLHSLEAGRGQLVFINSSVARRTRADHSHYAATKIGLKAVADDFREELNPKGVRVLSIFVGRTATPMQKAIADRKGLEYKPERLLQPGDVAAAILSCLSLPYTAEVKEMDIRPMYKG